MQEEIWKDVVGYEGLYEVSSTGRVKSLLFNKERILVQQSNGKGYLVVNLSKNKYQTNIKVHRLVAIAFIKTKVDKPQVNHINGIKTDNRAENLEWSTQSENVQHAYDIGLSPKGENRYNSKLTNEQVLSIRNDKRFQKEIAKEYNIDQSWVSRIKHKNL